jgi:hypothetical protein
MEKTIDDVLADLSGIIAECRAERSPLGYFPALYRRVTVKIKEGIAAGQFDDGARMERLDVLFAGRYVAAFRAYRAGRSPTRAWAYAFAMAGEPYPLILQHLMLGVNAHINLDLGVAAAETCGREELAGLRRDFDEVNSVLGALIDTVQGEIASVSPLLYLLDEAGQRTDETVCGFCLQRARDAAWLHAEGLALLPAEHRAPRIDLIDRGVASFARYICAADSALDPVLRRVRATESPDADAIIDALSQ